MNTNTSTPKNETFENSPRAVLFPGDDESLEILEISGNTTEGESTILWEDGGVFTPPENPQMISLVDILNRIKIMEERITEAIEKLKRDIEEIKEKL